MCTGFPAKLTELFFSGREISNKNFLPFLYFYQNIYSPKNPHFLIYGKGF
jgi:hypothetical protein